MTDRRGRSRRISTPVYAWIGVLSLTAASIALYNYGDRLSPSAAFDGLLTGKNSLTLFFCLMLTIIAIVNPGLLRPLPRMFGASGSVRTLAIVAFALGLLVGLATGVDQVAVDSGLAISGKVHYPAGSAMRDYFFGIWTSLAQLTAGLLYLGVDDQVVSVLICMLLSAVFFLSLSLAVFSISGRIFISLLIPYCLLDKLIVGGVLKSPDYPLLLLNSPHTFGVASLVGAVFITAALFAGWNRAAGLAAGVLLSIHPVLGAYMVGSLLTLFVVNHLARRSATLSPFVPEPGALRQVMRGLVIGLLITIASLFVFLSLRPEVSEVDVAALRAYSEFWDYHRSQRAEYGAALFSLLYLSAIAAILYYRTDLSDAVRRGLILTVILIGYSSTLYLAVHVAPGLLPEILVRAAPGRLLNVHAALADAVMCGLIAMAFYERIRMSRDGGSASQSNERSAHRLYPPFKAMLDPILAGAAVLALVYCLVVAPRQIQNHLVAWWGDEASRNEERDERFWRELRNTALDGMILTTESSWASVLRKAHKAPLIADIDFVPYLPHTARKVADIVTIGYGVDFHNPPENLRFRGAISEEAGKEYLERLDPAGWCTISDRLQVAGAVAPKDWALSLTPEIEGTGFSFYRIEGCDAEGDRLKASPRS